MEKKERVKFRKRTKGKKEIEKNTKSWKRVKVSENFTGRGRENVYKNSNYML